MWDMAPNCCYTFSNYLMNKCSCLPKEKKLVQNVQIYSMVKATGVNILETNVMSVIDQENKLPPQ